MWATTSKRHVSYGDIIRVKTVSKTQTQDLTSKASEPHKDGWRHS